MKKAILKALTLILACVFVLGMGIMSISADNAVPGDANNDGELSIIDALLIVKAVANGTALENSDVNGDGKTNLLDVIGVIKLIATGEAPEVGEEDKTTADIVVENGTVKEAVSINGEKVSAAVPEGVTVDDGTTSLTLSVSAMDSTGGNITTGETEDSVSYDVHIEGVSEANTVAIVVDLGAILPKGQNTGTVALYHVENGKTVKMTQVMTLAELDSHNEFYYYPATGNVYVALATFSEIVAVNDSVNAWQGEFDYSWYTEPQTLAENGDADYYIANADQLAAFGAIVGGMADGIEQNSFDGKTVKLLSDINIGDNEENNRSNIIFYPIGYNSSDGLYEKTGVAVTTGYYAFMGTFDGNGNTISNIYQNTWEMKGDHDWYDATLQYSRDGMGLFGKVYGGTVKNLTIDNFKSDGEIATTGVIAAYADCGATFENIAIVNCNPRVYNIGNGGIVGCAGWYARDSVTTPITFRNITVDQTNKISALWGSWGVSCGGILGQYYPVSGQTSAGNPANAGVHFENCHVAAIIDVNNDVCSNYQYYLYRYAGMLMGTIRQNTTDAKGNTVADTTGITAEGCTYTMGDWNEYWYCEIVKNSLASYTHDHQFSRLDKISSLSEIQDANGNWIKEGNFVILNEDNTEAVCYHIFKNSNGELYQHFHDVADESNPNIYEDFDLNGDGELNDLKEDRQRYYIPFNQLFTGLDMGVTPHFEFGGVKFVENGTVKSETKFTGLDVTTYTPNESITIGELFEAVDGKNISNSSVIVTVSPKTEDDTVSATYSPNTSDWTKGTLTFSENSTGTAKVVITDYFYCTPTVIYVTVAEAQPVDKFTAKENLTFTHTVEGGTIEKTLGDIFTAVDGVTIDSANVVVTADGVDYVKNESDWTKSTLSFTGTGEFVVTITDNNLCNTATATVTITEPQKVAKFVATNYEATHGIDNNTVTVTLDELFVAIDGVNINSANVTVTVEPEVTVEKDSDNWQNTTITFGAGTYTVTITDNNFCIPTTATVTIKEPDPIDKFTAKENLTFTHTVEGGTIEKTLGDIFTAVDGVTIDSANVVVTVDGVDYVKNESDWTQSTLSFTGTGTVNIAITDNYYCNEATATVTIIEPEDAVKFEKKFVDASFTYRIGNQNTVKLGSLFELKEYETEAAFMESDVVVTVENIDGTATGTYTENATWTNGTIQFNGTGKVLVTITDDNYCIPTELTLEVVEATNATTATNATIKNIVLLQNAGFSSLEVSGGYTLYGNGFTLTCGSDSYAADLGYAFVTLTDGTLDNVQIVCPNFDYAALYKSNLTNPDNRSYTDSAGKTRYYNAKSGVMVSGNSQILNSRISGARAAVNASSGNLLIDNSQIELGAVANILVGAANSVTLRDVTLVQRPQESTYKAEGAENGTTLMGFSVLIICNADGSSAPITLEGTLVQNAWVDENDKPYVPSAGESIISTVLSNDAYTHDLDGDGTKESLNLGFAYMPESANGTVNTTSITDDRSDNDKTVAPYDCATVNTTFGITTYVYSYKYSDGETIPTEYTNTATYVPNKYGDIIAVTYSDTTDGLTTGKSYGTDGWVHELNVDLDKLSGYALDFGKLSMTVNGVSVSDYTVDGEAMPTTPVAVITGGVTYNLTATVDGEQYTAKFKVTGTETSKDSPSLVASNYEAALLVGEAGSTFSKDTWHGAAPVLNGVQIRYWSVAEKQYKTITLSDYTPTTAGKQNGTNAEWTYSPTNGDFTLTIKNETAVHSSNGVFAMPVVVNNKLYFVASGSNGLVNYGNSARTIKINYYFNDNNGGVELKFDYTWSIECANGNTAYDYSDFCNGTSKTFTIKSSNGDSCVTPDTLVTLADGTQKRIDETTYEDNFLVWDFFEGKYTTTPAAIIDNHGYDTVNVVTVNFANGSSVGTINGHGFFDVDLNKFVLLDEYNVAEYVGHTFVMQDGDGYSTTQLVDYSIEERYTEVWSILTAEYHNCILEGMFTLTPGQVEGSPEYLMPFAVNDDMKYDAEAMAADIAEYGLYVYEDFADVITLEQFAALNLQYFKVAVGKGAITYDEIIYLLNLHMN